MFTVFPAIDLRHGRVVRLEEGRDDRQTTYGDDPVEVARGFVAAGAKAIHVVDLDAAFRDGDNRAWIEKVVRAVDVPIQVGGGVREDAHLHALLDVGVSRVIIGSAAVQNPEWVGALARQYPQQIIVGIDAKNGEVRTHGWVEGSGKQLIDVGQHMADLGVTRVIYTDIGRDGMLSGPDIEGSVALAQRTGLEVVVSGGVAGLQDIQAASQTGESNVVGVIVGKAIYEGRVTVQQAVEATQC